MAGRTVVTTMQRLVRCGTATTARLVLAAAVLSSVAVGAAAGQGGTPATATGNGCRSWLSPVERAMPLTAASAVEITSSPIDGLTDDKLAVSWGGLAGPERSKVDVSAFELPQLLRDKTRVVLRLLPMDLARLSAAGVYTAWLDVVDGGPAGTCRLTVFLKIPAALSTASLEQRSLRMYRPFPLIAASDGVSVVFAEKDGRAIGNIVPAALEVRHGPAKHLVPGAALTVAEQSFAIAEAKTARLDLAFDGLSAIGTYSAALRLSSQAFAAPVDVPFAVTVTDLWFWPALVIFSGVAGALIMNQLSTKLLPRARLVQRLSILRDALDKIEPGIAGAGSIVASALNTVRERIEAARRAIGTLSGEAAVKAAEEAYAALVGELDTALQKLAQEHAAEQQALAELETRGDAHQVNAVAFQRSLEHAVALLNETAKLFAAATLAPARERLRRAKSLRRIAQDAYVDALGDRVLSTIAGLAPDKQSQASDELTALRERWRRDDDGSTFAAVANALEDLAPSPTPAHGMAAMGAGTGAASAAYASLPLPVASGLDQLPSVASAQAQVERVDWVLAGFAVLLATLTGLLALYGDQPFGSVSDYVKAFVWGFGVDTTLRGFAKIRQGL